MDPYHKMLQKLYEATSGRDSVDVDFVDLTKKAGYFPSIDSIVAQLKKEGWVTESRTNVLRLTHWGVAEAKKMGSNSAGSVGQTQKEARRLLAEVKELAVLLEEFVSDTSEANRKALKAKFGVVTKGFETLSKS